MGGQISVMVTECMQGIISGFIFVIVTATILVMVKWSDIVQALNMAPVNASMIHPLKTSHTADFNIWFYLITVMASLYA